LIYGFVLKPYVPDLVPGNSMVEYLVEEGFDVYLLDFGISGHEDAGLSIEDLVLDYTHARSRISSRPRAPRRLAYSLSLRAARCAPCTPPCSRAGPSRTLSYPPRPRNSPRQIRASSGSGRSRAAPAARTSTRPTVPLFLGNLPTDLASQVINLGASAQATAVGTVARPFGSFGRGFSVYDVALREIRELARRDVSVRSWLVVSKWVDDAAPFPDETFRRWWGDFYQRDKLIKGKMSLREHRLDMSNIGCAVLNVSGEWDCTVPPSQTKATTYRASGPVKEYVSVNAGHVGMLAGPAAVSNLWPRLRGWLAPRSG
jgi:polyhydroxyalkanoate synthase subunit PhaC